VDRRSATPSLVNAARWATLTLGLLLATTAPGGNGAPYGAALLAHALWRTARPGRPDRGDVVATVLDVALHMLVVASTGGLHSPFVVCLVGPIAAIARAQQAQRHAAEREMQALGQLERLTEANTLLSELHRVAQTLPVSLELRATVSSTVTQVRELFEPNAMALLLRSDATGSWGVAAALGARLPSLLSTSDLPAPIAAAVLGTHTRLFTDLGHNLPGLSETTSTGLYAPLWARDQLIGVLAVERIIPGTLSESDRQLLEGVAQQAAVAIDNAHWFARLRRAGAEEERLRIARDLHDRVGQSLAYTAFELDRIARNAGESAIRDELQTLRSDTRQILGEVRETLSDLRADVTQERDLVETVDAFLDRVRRRSELNIAFEHAGQSRLPLPVEREVWRIAQEAVANVERHAQASRLDVRWVCGEGGATLEIVDDGTGMPAGSTAKPNSYGLVGMRERAETIGAALEIDSAPGVGTTIRCRIEAA
jgi:signal transduction histidine kinase